MRWIFSVALLLLVTAPSHIYAQGAAHVIGSGEPSDDPTETIVASPDLIKVWGECVFREAEIMASYDEPVPVLADAVVAACGNEQSAYFAQMQRDLPSFSRAEMMAARHEFREDARRKAVLVIVLARHRE